MMSALDFLSSLPDTTSPTSVYILNNTTSNLTLKTTSSPSNLDSHAFGVKASSATKGAITQVLWIDCKYGDTAKESKADRVFTTSLTVGGVAVQFQQRVSCPKNVTKLYAQITAGTQTSGWAQNKRIEDKDILCVIFTGTDGHKYQVAGAYSEKKLSDYDDTVFIINPQGPATSTSVFIQNNTASDLTLKTASQPTNLGSDAWGEKATSVVKGAKTEVLSIDRLYGSADKESQADRVFTTSLTVGGVAVQLQQRITSLKCDTTLYTQITAGTQTSGWAQSQLFDDKDTLYVIFAGTDGYKYQVVGTYSKKMSGYVDINFTINPRGSSNVLPNIEHVVVLMMENRSLDNLLGWIYDDKREKLQPHQFLPAGSPPVYNGLNTGEYFNSNPAVEGGRKVFASKGTKSWTFGEKTTGPYVVPAVDPGEEFDDIKEQTADNMSGFITNFLKFVREEGGPDDSAAAIMQCYSPEQVPVISTLAKSFAVSDAWFSSVPSQTWPNRAFFFAGDSAGNVDNNIKQNLFSPEAWHVPTIFDVLDEENISWKVFQDSFIPAITQTIFSDKHFFDKFHFKNVNEFYKCCKQSSDAPNLVKLPTYTFLEPDFGVFGYGSNSVMTDRSYHPPYDVRPAEEFLAKVYESIRTSPYVDKIMFVLLFDEPGGTYDHVPPPMGAAQPHHYPVAKDGHTFDFTQFGYRVPAVVVSSYVKPGTVFRSPTSTPLDHTSINATLRDWLGLADVFKQHLPSSRIAAAPTIAHVLTETSPQAWPIIQYKAGTDPQEEHPVLSETPHEHKLNDLQQALHVSAASAKRGAMFTQEEKVEALNKISMHGDAQSWLSLFENFGKESDGVEN